MDKGLDGLASWSAWLPFREAVDIAPRLPGVYLARERSSGQLVYVGMAGERRGHGVRGRLRVYLSGKAAVSGLGEAAMDQALEDASWIRERLGELDRGVARRAKGWAALALDRADLEVCFAVVEDRAKALALERAVLDCLQDSNLWNRAR